MRDLQVIMRMEMRDMMWVRLSLGLWELLTTAFKPLVALLRHQCTARRLVRPFRMEPFLNHVVVVHRIHSMTLGMVIMTLGALLSERALLTTLLHRLAAAVVQLHRGLPASRAHRPARAMRRQTGRRPPCRDRRSTRTKTVEEVADDASR